MNPVIEKTMRKLPSIIALFAIASATSMIFLDATIIPVALPTIQRDLNVTPLGIQWIINSYLLVLAVLVYLGGKLADRFGHRRIFCIGLLIFAGASAIGGLAENTEWLILSRTIQGIGGAFLGPSALSLVIDTFPAQVRGRYLGIIVGFSSLFLSLGPFLGGLFTEYFTWRLLFWINLPVAITGLTLTLLFVPKSRKTKVVFDYIGFTTFSCALLALILTLMQGKSWGWSSRGVLSLFALFLLFVTILVMTELRARVPFFDRKLFSIPTFLGGNIIILLTQFLLTMTIFWAIYFQDILQYSPMQAGSMTLFATFPILVVAPTAGHLVDRFGPRLPMTIGFSLVTFGLCWFFALSVENSAILLAPALLAFGSGIALVMTPNSTTTLSAVPENKRGAASGIYNTMRYVGATLGVAILGALITNLGHYYFSNDLKGIGIEQVPLEPYTPEVLKMYLKANYLSYSIATITATAISIVALVVTFVYFKNKKA